MPTERAASISAPRPKVPDRINAHRLRVALARNWEGRQVDETYTRANEQLAEFRVLLDLAAERLWDLQSDFMVLRTRW
jgi:hypothetical protein